MSTTTREDRYVAVCACLGLPTNVTPGRQLVLLQPAAQAWVDTGIECEGGDRIQQLWSSVARAIASVRFLVDAAGYDRGLREGDTDAPTSDTRGVSTPASMLGASRQNSATEAAATERADAAEKRAAEAEAGIDAALRKAIANEKIAEDAKREADVARSDAATWRVSCEAALSRPASVEASVRGERERCSALAKLAVVGAVDAALGEAHRQGALPPQVGREARGSGLGAATLFLRELSGERLSRTAFDDEVPSPPPPAPEAGEVTIPMELARVTSAHRHAALVAEEERAAREDTLVDWRRVSAEARRLACIVAPLPPATGETSGPGLGGVAVGLAAGECGCMACSDARNEATPFRFGFRYSCEICGNKRCPHHAHHELACTGSNEPDQVGAPAPIETCEAAKRDGVGNAIVPEADYYVQDKRSFVGNCVLWWGCDNKGYVCELDKAGVYKGVDVAGMRDTDVPWPVDVVRANVAQHVQIEPLQRAARDKATEADRG